MPAYRLDAPLHPDAVRGRPVWFRHDGRRVEGREGEPVAVSLLAAGRPVLSRSFRFHRPRGLMCSTGQCGWCECRVDGRPGVRSCEALVADGTDARSEHSWPNAGRDLFGLLDLGSRWIPNTFYHHRFLWPRRARRLYLDVLRRFGGRGRLTPGAAPASPRRAGLRQVDVAVVGGGPAGMLAALGAAERGASVLLLEAADALGGGWRWRIDPLPIEGTLPDVRARVEGTSGIEVLSATTALGRYDEGLAAVGPRTAWEIRARAVVAATGSHERVPRVPNNDRPGVMGARTVEWLVNAFGVVPGRRAVLLEGGPEIERAAGALRAAGSTIVTEGARLAAVGGRDRVRSALVETSGGGRRRFEADLVVFDGRIPNLDLALACGVEVSAEGAGLVASIAGDARGTAAGLFLAGACAGRPIADAADAEAAIEAGRTAASWRPASALAAEAAAPSAAWPIVPRTEAAHDDAFVCFCEDVRARELRAEVHETAVDPEILKRRTAVLTGPCQGKYCLDAFVRTVNAACQPDPAWRVPTSRPPLRPVRLGDLVVEPAGEREA